MLGYKTLPVLLPLVVLLLGIIFHGKQNSKDPWTGGPISWPKAFWLANAIVSWFMYPICLFFVPGVPDYLQLFLWVHLIGWWIRGPLELVMIYKWLNWSPKYGITHDLCQLVFYVVILGWAFLKTSNKDFAFYFAFSFGIYIIIQMIFEATFARLFLLARSEEEAKENIYFASDDPKWIFINRLTFLAVCFSFLFGIGQGALLLFAN